MTPREKKMIAGGVVVGPLILAIAYGVAPLVREWRALGRDLEPKALDMERLRERSRQQQRLLAERDVLTTRLGCLLGPEALPPAKPSEPPKQPVAAAKDGDKPAPNKTAPPPPAGEAASPPSDDSSKNVAVASPAGPGAPPSPAPEPGPPPPSPDKPASPQAAKPEKDKPPPGISLATHIERKAKASGVEVQQIVPANPAACWKGAADFRGVGLRISFEANVTALVKFLHALEKGDRLVRVEQAELRRDPQKGQNTSVVLHVVGYEIAERQP